MARLLPLPERDRPLVFAHRGVSSEAPENTMAAFTLAKQKGVPGVELDIHLSSDGKLVVIHDHNTGRVAPGTDLDIEASTMAELKAVDIGSWKGSRFKDERPPLLAELFEELGGDLYFDVEIKSGESADRGLEAAFARLLSDFGFGAERIVVSSFNPLSIGRFKVACPSVPTGIIYCIDDDVPWYLRHGEGRWLGHADFLKPRSTQATRAGLSWSRMTGGRRVIPWTVDDPVEAARVLSIGCDGIISNVPHRLGLPGLS
ncbi:MAG: glycerophosphodiester phosphodiesterase [Spirochaetae bacterium HGW-Spirochaetae-7]|nr:MAG: glycerophosphodiester phosphodiesterase [Spirochaetae bacterium HGW-Spirochaetae-7]